VTTACQKGAVLVGAARSYPAVGVACALQPGLGAISGVHTEAPPPSWSHGLGATTWPTKQAPRRMCSGGTPTRSTGKVSCHCLRALHPLSTLCHACAQTKLLIISMGTDFFAWRPPVRDLNSGTFGFVELAMDKTTGQQVAIKFIERGDKVGFQAMQACRAANKVSGVCSQAVACGM